MDRRKFLIGMGSLAAGSAAAIGTGAFTSASADRNADLVVEGDASAFLGIAPADSKNADKYVDYSDGTLGLNLDEDSDGPGKGLNQRAATRIKDLFTITNNGSQAVTISIKPNDSGIAGYRLKWVNENGGGTKPENENPKKAKVSGTTIEVGEKIVVGLDLKLGGNDVGDVLTDQIIIRAEA